MEIDRRFTLWSRAMIFQFAHFELDIDRVELRADGVAFRNDILDGPGGRQILAEDPSGNCIELFEARG